MGSAAAGSSTSIEAALGLGIVEARLAGAYTASRFAVVSGRTRLSNVTTTARAATVNVGLAGVLDAIGTWIRRGRWRRGILLSFVFPVSPVLLFRCCFLSVPQVQQAD